MLAIPPEQKYEPNPAPQELYSGSKWIVRRAMTGILPEPIRTRKTKTVFTGVFQRDLQTEWATFESTFGPGSNSAVAALGYITPDGFWSRLQALRDGAECRDFFYLATIVGLEGWLRTFTLPRQKLVAVPTPLRSSEESN